MVKKVLIALLIVLVLLILLVGGYVAYLFIDFHRIPDDQALTASTAGAAALPAGEELGVVSWNIGFGAYSADFTFFMDGGTESRAFSKEACEENVNAVIEKLSAWKDELMLIQEVDFDSDRSRHVDQRKMFEATFPEYSAVFAQNYDSSYFIYPVNKPIGAAKSGVLTLSGAQIGDAVRRSLPIEGGINKFFDLDRCYSVSSIPVSDGRTLKLYNVHLSAYSSDGSIAREQLALMAQEMAADYAAGSYVIAGGDFNQDLWGDSGAYSGVTGVDASWCKPFPAELLPEGFTLVNSLDEENLVLSSRNTNIPYKRGESFEATLDGFIVSDNVQVRSCTIVDTAYANTDHNPVRMRFVLGGA